MSLALDTARTDDRTSPARIQCPVIRNPADMTPAHTWRSDEPAGDPPAPLPVLPPAPPVAARHYRVMPAPRPRRFLWLTRQMRRLRLLIWWTITLQLGRHARCFFAARRAVAADRQHRVSVVPVIRAAIRHPKAHGIAITASDTPRVSVIIPTYGQLGYTLRCLASIAAYPPAAPIEVLVVDDASPDPAMAALAEVQGIRLIRNATNRGFLHSCNDAARQARGEYLLFLNNDTQMLENWLDPMLALFAARPEAGIVGARLLFPDGRQQEAGGIIWNDASGWNYGRGDDPGKPAYNYVREVDYVSGAALMVPADLFASLDGFDPCYAPAYCEDSDLAFRVRAAGRSVLYQPLSRVVHFEGISHGTDLSVGIKAHQVVNQARLAARWADTLAAEQAPPGLGVLRARDRAGQRRVILIADHWVPEPDRDAGSRTMAGLIAVLLRAGMIVKFWPANGRASAGYAETLQSMGVEVLYGMPMEAGRSPRLADWLAQNGVDLDDVLLSRPGVAEGVLALIRKHSTARIFFYGHDLHFARLRAQAAGEGDLGLTREAALMERRERAIWRKVDMVLCPSAEEAATVAALEPCARVRAIVPFGFADFAAPRPAPRSQEVLFVAGFAHPPNAAALLWFVAEILPALQRRVPGARLRVVGSSPPKEVRALAGPGIAIEADVDDARLAACYAQARAAAVPLRFGAGVKLKVVEALRHGLPLVTTRIGAQGLAGFERVGPVCDTPEDFADTLARLLTDDAAWVAQSRAGLAYVRAGFSTEAMARRLLAALAEPQAAKAALPRRRRTSPSPSSAGASKASEAGSGIGTYSAPSPV